MEIPPLAIRTPPMSARSNRTRKLDFLHKGRNSRKIYRDSTYEEKELLLDEAQDVLNEIESLKNDNFLLRQRLNVCEMKYDNECQIEVEYLQKFSNDQSLIESAQSRYQLTKELEDLQHQLACYTKDFEFLQEEYSQDALRKIKANIVEQNQIIALEKNDIQALNNNKIEIENIRNQSDHINTMKAHKENTLKIKQLRKDLKKLRKVNKKAKTDLQRSMLIDEELEDMRNLKESLAQRLKSLENQRASREKEIMTFKSIIDKKRAILEDQKKLLEQQTKRAPRRFKRIQPVKETRSNDPTDPLLVTETLQSKETHEQDEVIESNNTKEEQVSEDDAKPEVLNRLANHLVDTVTNQDNSVSTELEEGKEIQSDVLEEEQKEPQLNDAKEELTEANTIIGAEDIHEGHQNTDEPIINEVSQDPTVSERDEDILLPQENEEQLPINEEHVDLSTETKDTSVTKENEEEEDRLILEQQPELLEKEDETMDVDRQEEAVEGSPNQEETQPSDHIGLKQSEEQNDFLDEEQEAVEPSKTDELDGFLEEEEEIKHGLDETSQQYKEEALEVILQSDDHFLEEEETQEDHNIDIDDKKEEQEIIEQPEVTLPIPEIEDSVDLSQDFDDETEVMKESTNKDTLSSAIGIMGGMLVNDEDDFV